AIPLAFAATLAIAWASARRRGPRGPQSSRADRMGPRGIRIGLLWLVAGTVPLILTAPAWSAHHYLFALCGLALLVGAWAARQAHWLGPTLVAVVALGSANTRELDAVAKAPNAWSSLSHVNRHSVLADV